MSHRLVSLSADLQRLENEGYEVDIQSNYLLVRHVPYLTAEKTVAYGILVSELTTSGETTAPPSTHAVSFTGSIPCDRNGQPLDKIINDKTTATLAEGIVIQCAFSASHRAGIPTTTRR